MQSFLIKHELSKLWQNKNHRLLFYFLFTLIASYVFLLLPHLEKVDAVPLTEMQLENESLEAIQLFRAQTDRTSGTLMAPQSAYVMDAEKLDFQQRLVTAFQEENWLRYRYLYNEYLIRESNEHLSNFIYAPNSPYPAKDNLKEFQQRLFMYEQTYQVPEPTLALIEEKTAMQQFVFLLKDYGLIPYLILLLVFGSSILTHNLKHVSLVQGFPIRWKTELNSKAIALLTYVSIGTCLLYLLFFVLVSMRFGVGPLLIEIPVIGERESTLFYHTVGLPLGKYMLLLFPVFLLFSWLTIRLLTIGSLLFKNEWMALSMTALLLFSERLYFTRSTREIFSIDASYFPQSYTLFSQIITGEKNFLLNVETFTYSKGILVLLVTAIIIEGIFQIVASWMTRQRFYKK